MISAHTGGAKHPLPNFVSYVGVVIFIAAGLLGATRSMSMWRLQTWKYKNPEALAPSRAGLALARVVGVVGIAVGVALLVLAIRRDV